MTPTIYYKCYLKKSEDGGWDTATEDDAERLIIKIRGNSFGFDLTDRLDVQRSYALMRALGAAFEEGRSHQAREMRTALNYNLNR